MRLIVLPPVAVRKRKGKNLTALPYCPRHGTPRRRAWPLTVTCTFPSDRLWRLKANSRNGQIPRKRRRARTFVFRPDENKGGGPMAKKADGSNPKLSERSLPTTQTCPPLKFF